jgi:ABC-type glycerol-3-phosphate transport system permease component
MADARMPGVSTGRPFLRHAILILASICMVYPLLWMIGSSFKPETQIFSDPGALPTEFKLDSYVDGWDALRVSFDTFYINSFIIAILSVIGNLVACSLAAYAFARLEFRLKWLWFALMLGTLMLPYHVTLVPQYILFLKLGWAAADRAEIPCCRCLLHLPDGAVLPRHSARDRRSGRHGRLRPVAHLLANHAALVDAGAGDRGDLLVHLDL